VSPGLGWKASDMASWVGGDLVDGPSDPIAAVETDSRRLSAGAAFVAIRGEHFDGHDFVGEAIASGAVLAVVERGRAGDRIPRLEVDDTLTALRDLAAARRAELDIPVVAVTGSTGKTSTKDMLRSVLAGSWASPASYNNEVGVPLTILATPDSAAYLVAEVGSRGVGHIGFLTPAVRPDVAVITNLGLVHLETFGTTDRLADAKWELVEGLSPGGLAVLPRDEPRLRRIHSGRTVTFGDGAGADVWFDAPEFDGGGRATFDLVASGKRARVSLAMAGRHQPWNAVAAAAAAVALGVPLSDVARRLGRAAGSPGRMEIHPGRVTIVNDAYNANPDSMEAALRTVTAMPGRHVAVLGLMAELGSAAEEEHARIGELAVDLGIARLIVVGEEPGMAAAAGGIATRVADADEAAVALRSVVRDGDVVLVKASHSLGLEALAARLVEEVGK
jgi:UDP-N-acetylmuramoyl-tripeptide--D-alanyl-D-alanine ligase